MSNIEKFAHLLSDGSEESLTRALWLSQASDGLRVILELLSPREKKIIKMRYGLRDSVGHTLEQVARDFGVTRERIRQIETKVLQKIRDMPESLYIR